MIVGCLEVQQRGTSISHPEIRNITHGIRNSMSGQQQGSSSFPGIGGSAPPTAFGQQQQQQQQPNGFQQGQGMYRPPYQHSPAVGINGNVVDHRQQQLPPIRTTVGNGPPMQYAGMGMQPSTQQRPPMSNGNLKMGQPPSTSFVQPQIGAPGQGGMRPMSGPPPMMQSRPSMAPGNAPPSFAVTSPSKPVPSTQGIKSIDPSQMPRPSSTILPAQVFETRRDGTHTVPPSTEVPLAVRDTGDAGPRYMRSSLNSIPQGNDMVKASAIPLVVAIQPLALQSKGDSGIPLIDQRRRGPFRCSACNAYACPFMKFSPDGNTMTCCFCGGTTQVPSEHAGPVGMDGRRTDVDIKPEFGFGTVEHIVDGKYQIRDPMLPTYMFLIDCTSEAVSSGMTFTVCSAIASLLESIPSKERARVAIVTFNSTVSFYEFKTASSGDPTMFVMGDLDDPFCPISMSAFASPETHSKPLKNLLDRIPQLYKDTHAAESAGGAAIKACVETLKYVGGGRLLSFISSLPHKGFLALRPREAGKPPSEKESLDIMTPIGNGKQYIQLAKEAAQQQVSIDIFALTKSYVDLATLRLLSTYTSGSVYRYSPFVCSADTQRFYDDLRWNLTRPAGFEAVGRIRVSSGLSVDEVLGAYCKVGQNDLLFPSLSSDSTLFAKISHDQRLREGSQACFQFATLYSTPGGQRRVRVHSLALPVTRSLGSVFRGADLEIYMGYVARQVIMSMPGKSLASMKDVVTKTVSGTLLAYRKHCATSSSSGQLILPESLKLMPLFCLGLIKLPCFRTDARADARAVWMSRILSLPIDRLFPVVHPRLFKVPLEVISNSPEVPERLPLTAEKIESNGLYILENGFDLFVQIGRDVPSQCIEQLLGTPSLQGIDPSSFCDLPAQDNPLSKQVALLIAQLRRQRRSYMHTRIVIKGHPYETLFHSALIEDRHVLSGMSYVEYLCFLHRQIQNKMT